VDSYPVTLSSNFACSKTTKAVRTFVIDAGKYLVSPFLEYNTCPVVASIKVVPSEFKLGGSAAAKEWLDGIIKVVTINITTKYINLLKYIFSLFINYLSIKFILLIYSNKVLVKLPGKY
jgi:hypothetical protein